VKLVVPLLARARSARDKAAETRCPTITPVSTSGSLTAAPASRPYRSVLLSSVEIWHPYAARQEGCPFCDLGAVRIVADNALAVLIRDAFPVTPGHLLAIPRRHVGTWFDLHRPEQHAVSELVRQGRALRCDSDRTVGGFNAGINDGDVAGQTVPHSHVHVIPRRAADVENPRGGVRNVIPGKDDYAVS
jgi:diadenosine tetraphosphate (Ap4A) HIT family hydrolase